jgi:hypothetical protein
MSWGCSGAIIDLLFGAVFLAIAFTKRWHRLSVWLNPYTNRVLVIVVSLIFGLMTLYAGVTKLVAGNCR